MTTSLPDRYAGTHFLLRRKLLKLFGGAFHIYAEDGSVAFYSKMKAFKLKEDLRIYGSEDMTEELLRIAARSIIDIGATYDVYDSATGAKIGALKRKGLKSILRDEWVILDAQDRPVGGIVDPRMLLSILRRFVPYLELIPQSFEGTIGETRVFTFRQLFNPLIHKVALDFSADATGLMDRRLGLAAGVLLCAIEGHGGG